MKIQELWYHFQAEKIEQTLLQRNINFLVKHYHVRHALQSKENGSLIFWQTWFTRIPNSSDKTFLNNVKAVESLPQNYISRAIKSSFILTIIFFYSASHFETLQVQIFGYIFKILRVFMKVQHKNYKFCTFYIKKL